MFTIGTGIGMGLIFQNRDELEKVVTDLQSYIAGIKDENKDRVCVFMMGDSEVHADKLKEVAIYLSSRFQE